MTYTHRSQSLGEIQYHPNGPLQIVIADVAARVPRLASVVRPIAQDLLQRRAHVVPLGVERRLWHVRIVRQLGLVHRQVFAYHLHPLLDLVVPFFFFF